MSKNKIYTSTDQRIFQGDFPIETNALTLQTTVEAGDIVALSTGKKCWTNSGYLNRWTCKKLC